MDSTKSIFQQRSDLLRDLFPAGVPPLWCPLLTHYSDKNLIDFERMSAHLGYIAPWVKGLLIPGSTGDGWELSDDETLKVVRFAVEECKKRGLSLLLGALKPDIPSMKDAIERMLDAIKDAGGAEERDRRLKAAGVAGLTVCPPWGRDKPQEDIYQSLSEILDMGFPTALYQLPQVTENEIGPEIFRRLTEKYPNLIFFKDTSGDDRIVLSRIDTGGVYVVRGAEKDYIRWLKAAGGSYDGFLLSSANSFPEQLSLLIEYIAKGDLSSAGSLSDRLSNTLDEMFALAQTVPWGNQFTNANKAIDHYNAFGPSAFLKEPPMLHAGVRMPAHVIRAAGEILKRYGLMAKKGYLE